MCDAIMEAISVALSQAYIEATGHVLHHNVDKGFLVAGQTVPALGGGAVVAPMRLICGDRATMTADSLYQGMELLARKLWKELESAGLERIDPAGLPFDPALHEAVATTPPITPEQDHTVCRTFQAGYRFKGALLRPARVQVYADPGQA